MPAVPADADLPALRPPFAPQAVVFDLDGLLVDTEPRWEDAERRLVAMLGGTWDPALRPRLLGAGQKVAADVLAAHLGGLDPKMIARRMLVTALDEFRRGVPARPGAGELLAALVGRLPLAVATNSQRVLADTALEAAGLEGLVGALVCYEDVDEPKPSPQPYLRACGELGVDPAGCVAFEDSPSGIASAVAAGLWTVACPSVEGVGVDGAHAEVGSLLDVDVESLLVGRGDG